MLLIFSTDTEKHGADVRTVLTMLQENSMKADPWDCVWEVGKSTDEVYMVVNTGAPEK